MLIYAVMLPTSGWVADHFGYKRTFLLGLAIFTLGLFLASLILALSNGNASWNTDGWKSNFIITCFFISGLSLFIFLASEKVVVRPFIDLSLFKVFSFGMSTIVLFVFGLGMFGSNFLIPLYLQRFLGYTPLQAGLVFLPVGLLVAISAPIGGIITDRFSGKIPVVLGILLMAFSLHQFSNLSLLTEKKDILIPLYIRGFGMGFIFSPLSAIAISQIPNEKMAQASGLINVVRQIGGSLGVAIFGTMLTNRTIFHTAMYGQSISPYSVKFTQIVKNLSFSIRMLTGGTAANSIKKAQVLIISHIQSQAFVRAVGDVFFVASLVVAAAVIPILILKTEKRSTGKVI